MAQMVPPSFVNQAPKLRVLILAKLEWPEMAKNRGEHLKMAHSLETEIFFQGCLNWKVVAPGILVMCPVDKKRNSETRN